MELMEEKMDLFIKKCKQEGLKITPQRIAVYEILLNSKSHPTVEEIYEEVRKRYPFVSLATVYRTVETLEQVGLVRKVCYWGSSARYDANTKDHHHIVCIKCGIIRDIHVQGEPQISEKPEGFEVLGYSINFYGLCSSCKKNHSST